MKKVLSTILGLGCFVSMMLASSEVPDGSADFLWSFAWVGSAVACGLLFAKLNPNFTKAGIHHE